MTIHIWCSRKTLLICSLLSNTLFILKQNGSKLSFLSWIKTIWQDFLHFVTSFTIGNFFRNKKKLNVVCFIISQVFGLLCKFSYSSVFKIILPEKKKEKKLTHAFYCSFFLLACKQNANFILNSWRKKKIWIKYEIKSWEHRILPLNFRYCRKATKLNKKSTTFFEIT